MLYKWGVFVIFVNNFVNMRKILACFVALFLLVACKKDRVDATNQKTFQESINDMASELPTFQQEKFNEALYILKTFGVESETDIAKMKSLSVLLNGKNVNEIFQMADKIAKENNIDWSSTAPPSLGAINIFANSTAKEYDPNDVNASAIKVDIEEIGNTSLGANGVTIIPKLLDGQGNLLDFSNASLEVILEVYSGGARISTAKNLMRDNNFKGFNLQYSSFSEDKVLDGKIDIAVIVKTTKKKLKKSVFGLEVNQNVLKSASKIERDSLLVDNEEVLEESKKITSPKTVVSKFLSNIGSQNLKGAFSASENPDWGNYDKFSNSVSGFGGVKSLTIKNITAPSNTEETIVSVSATYDVTNEEGEVTQIKANFKLKNKNGDWKIIGYQLK